MSGQNQCQVDPQMKGSQLEAQQRKVFQTSFLPWTWVSGMPVLQLRNRLAALQEERKQMEALRSTMEQCQISQKSRVDRTHRNHDGLFETSKLVPRLSGKSDGPSARMFSDSLGTFHPVHLVRHSGSGSVPTARFRRWASRWHASVSQCAASSERDCGRRHP